MSTDSFILELFRASRRLTDKSIPGLSNLFGAVREKVGGRMAGPLEPVLAHDNRGNIGFFKRWRSLFRGTRTNQLGRFLVVVRATHAGSQSFKPDGQSRLDDKQLILP